MQQTKRHHYVPKAYLKAFCDAKGKLLVYRKEGPPEPLYVSPDATQFRRYYYSQESENGEQDNNTLEELFSTVETDWPKTVAMLRNGENVNDRLEYIFNFIALQRARVPAARDAIEAQQARVVKDTFDQMFADGMFPPPPPGLDLSKVQVTIDPNRSLQAIPNILNGMGELFSRMGIMAVHNNTGRPFLTSDNPVLWFDPTLPFREQLPYTIGKNHGAAILFFFPVSPDLAILGSNEYRAGFSTDGLIYSEVPDEAWVEMMNAQVCRFGYEAVIARQSGQEEIIQAFLDVSPIHQAISMPSVKGKATLHQHVFGKRALKPKWIAKN